MIMVKFISLLHIIDIGDLTTCVFVRVVHTVVITVAGFATLDAEIIGTLEIVTIARAVICSKT